MADSSKTEKWPSSEVPYKTLQSFRLLGGQQIIDGKSYYPDALCLRMTPDQALHLLEDIVRGLQNRRDEIIVSLSGKMQNEAE